MNFLKKTTAILLVLSLSIALLGFSVSASSYKDVEDSKYYKDAVEALTTYGIVSGYSGYFKPGE